MSSDPLTVIHGDALSSLRGLEDESVQCCVTSPPYWGLRDYGHEWQIGLEKTPEEYVARLVEIFREMKRVLRGDGTVFLNLGDSYCGSGQGFGDTKTTNKGHNGSRQRVKPDWKGVFAYGNGDKAIPDSLTSDWSSESLYDERKDVSENRSLRTALRRVGKQSLASCLRIRECTAELLARLPSEDSSPPLRIEQSLSATQDRLQTEVRAVEMSLASLVSTNLESSSPHAAGLMLTDDLSAFRSLLESFVADVLACADRLGGLEETPDCKAGIVSLCEELTRRIQYTFSYCSQLVSRLNYSNQIFAGVNNLKPKDLVGIPWMAAFALRADGWYLRSDIIWSKPNPMPESVTDRPTKSHEYIFLLSRSERYYYDAVVIQEEAKEGTDLGLLRGKGKSGDPGVAWHAPSIRSRQAAGIDSRSAGTGWRNKRSVWAVPTAPYSGAHFATFPPDLIKPCILAGAPVGGVVLDPFAGSGTTGKVAIELGRKAILIEPKAEYVEMIKRRCQTTMGLQFA